ncbi:GA-binding protein subunit beta-1, partial [Geodia barretti]
QEVASFTLNLFLCTFIDTLISTIDLILFLIHHCVSPSPQGRTELHDAAERGDVEAVERLLSTSVNINSRTEDVGDTALLVASRRGHVEVVRLLLKAGAAVFIPDKCCRTPLYWASFYDHRAVVELLIENGADVNICNEVYILYHDSQRPL